MIKQAKIVFQLNFDDCYHSLFDQCYRGRFASVEAYLDETFGNRFWDERLLENFEVHDGFVFLHPDNVNTQRLP